MRICELCHERAGNLWLVNGLNICSFCIETCLPMKKNMAYVPLYNVEELLGIAQEIANDSNCDLVTSERRLKLYQAIHNFKKSVDPGYVLKDTIEELDNQCSTNP